MLGGLYTGYDSHNNHWEIYEDGNGWHWRKLNACGGMLDIVNGTETYESRKVCEESIRSLHGMDGKFSPAFKTEIVTNASSIKRDCSASPKRAKDLKKIREELQKEFDNNPPTETIEFKDKEAFLLRLRRAISWLGRAQQIEEDVKKTDNDLNTQFIFLWIGFNALYARDPHKDSSQKDQIDKYFLNLLCGEKAEGNIYKTIYGNILKERIESLRDDIFVSKDYWNPKMGIYRIDKEDIRFPGWKKEFTKQILCCMFQRLYVLRNQLMHGASTWDSKLNKRQLRGSTKIMHHLLPVFIEIMLDTPKDKWNEWGKIWYPRILGVGIEGKPYEETARRTSI